MFASADEIHNPVQTKVKSDRQAVIDSNPLAEQILPLLATFKDRIRSEQSWRVYCQDMKHFLTWLTQEGTTSLSAIAPDSMYRYHGDHSRTGANGTLAEKKVPVRWFAQTGQFVPFHQAASLPPFWNGLPWPMRLLMRSK